MIKILYNKKRLLNWRFEIRLRMALSIYPFIIQELLARYLDSYLHYLSLLPGVEKVIAQLKKIKHKIFDLLVALRRPTDALGKR